MADNEEKFIYRIQTEGADEVKKAIDELAKKIEFLSKEILKQTQLISAFDSQLKKLNSTISQASSLSRTEKSQREAQVSSIAKQKKETEDYIKTLEKELTTLKNVIETMQMSKGVSSPSVAPGILSSSEAKRAAEIAKELALEVRQIKFELAAVAQQSKESFKVTAERMIQAYAEKKRASMEYVFDQQKAEADIRSYAKQTREAARQLTQEEIQQTKNAAEIRKTANKQVMQSSKQRADYEKKLAKEELNAQKNAKGLAGAFSNLGKVGSFVFGGVLGLIGVDALRSIVNWFKQAAIAGKEFVTSMYKLSVGARAMQRVGVGITIKDVYENIEKLRESFGIFTKQELIEGTASLLNLTRTFGFTKKQIFDLQESVLTLAVVNNRAADEVQRIVALALSSGYTEGLQRLGVSINKVTITQKASTLGWKKGYNALTEYQRALSTYILIQERVVAYEEDLKKYQETAPGRIDKVSAAWTDLSTDIGKELTPLWAAMSERLFELIPLVMYLVELIKKAFTGLFTYTDSFFGAMDKVMSGEVKGVKEFRDAMIEAGQEAATKWEELIMFTDDKGKDYAGKPMMVDYFEEGADDLLEGMEKLGEDVLKEQKDAQEKIKQEEIDFGEDMRGITKEYTDKMAEIWKDYFETIHEIEEEEKEEILKARKELEEGIADANKDYNEKLAEANKEYRDNEIKAQKDYQEELRRLRDQFLFDLEDALRARDASQVMRLIRKYNLDKAQLDREREEEKAEKAKEHQEEIADLKKERADKIKELQQEFAERLAEIKEQAEKERKEASEERAKEMAEAKAAYEEDKKEREKEHAEEIKELKKHLEERIAELTTALGLEYDLTDRELRDLGLLYERLFGKGGKLEGYYEYFAGVSSSVTEKVLYDVNEIKNAWDTAIDLFQEMQELTANPETLPGSPGSLENPTGGVPGYASGGRLVATRPTLALFGESGIGEVAEFTPLNQVGSSNNGGKANIKITLAKGLIAEIVDNTMGQIGDIQLEMQR
jgi:hypothetical protein